MSLNIKYGVSTWLWTSPFTTATIEELFPKIAGMGYDVVEIAVEDPALMDLEAVKSALKRYNLEAAVCGAFGPGRDLTNEDEKVQRDCLAYISSCLEITAALNAGFFGGPMYSAVGKARMASPEQRKIEWGLAVKNLGIVCEMAADLGLKIAIEPLNRFESDLVNSAADALQLVKDINHPAAAIMLDGFHMNIEEKNIEQAIVLAGEKLVHLQVSENYRGTPGTGQTRWDQYKSGLEAINYSGIVSIESFTPDNKELAGAVCFWHPMADDQDQFASEGLSFLKNWAG